MAAPSLNVVLRPIKRGENTAHPPPDLTTAGSRPWFKKKRFLIPLAILVLLVIAGALGGKTEKSSSSPQSEPSLPQSAATVDHAQSTEDPKETEPLATVPRAPQSTETTTEVESPAPEADQASPSQKNAMRTAERYLDFSAFSKSGLIKQLEFEKFSTEDAIWAVDHIAADWNEQAVKSAKSFLEFSSFSHQGLVDQLVFEGFTPEEAEYGVSQTGL